MCGYPAAYYCIEHFSETDFTEDLKSIEIPMLFIHGNDDQIVPIADAAELAVKLVKDGELKVYDGAPHGLCTTLKDEISKNILTFAQGPVLASV